MVYMCDLFLQLGMIKDDITTLYTIILSIIEAQHTSLTNHDQTTHPYHRTTHPHDLNTPHCTCPTPNQTSSQPASNLTSLAPPHPSPSTPHPCRRHIYHQSPVLTSNYYFTTHSIHSHSTPQTLQTQTHPFHTQNTSPFHPITLSPQRFTLYSPHLTPSSPHSFQLAATTTLLCFPRLDTRPSHLPPPVRDARPT